jgi:hypothetical protein
MKVVMNLAAAVVVVALIFGSGTDATDYGDVPAPLIPNFDIEVAAIIAYAASSCHLTCVVGAVADVGHSEPYWYVTVNLICLNLAGILVVPPLSCALILNTDTNVPITGYCTEPIGYYGQK